MRQTTLKSAPKKSIFALFADKKVHQVYSEITITKKKFQVCSREVIRWQMDGSIQLTYTVGIITG